VAHAGSVSSDVSVPRKFSRADRAIEPSIRAKWLVTGVPESDRKSMSSLELTPRSLATV
jgi:hypothetical protein